MFHVIIDKLFTIDIWRIGIAKIPKRLSKKTIYSIEPSWINIDNVEFEADPFIFSLDGRDYIAYEKLNYSLGDAKLSCVDLNGKNYDFFDEVNKYSGHKSFPLTKYIDNKLYCIPETSDLLEISLYVYDVKVNRFVKSSVLLSGERYIDSVLYEDNGYYYIFTSTSDEPDKQLLFYSENLLGGYKLHQSSPISSGAFGGRNAGDIITIDGVPHRVAQDNTRTYGGGLVFKSIKHIDHLYYEEKFEFSIDGEKLSLSGIHNISVNENLMVIDGKYKSIRLKNLLKKIKYKIAIMKNRNNV